MSDEKEKELIQHLKSMPDIIDKRNKADLFKNISTNVETEPKRKKFNVVPLVATVSALFLVILVPFLLNNNANQMSDRMVHNESSDMGEEESVSFSDSDSDAAEEESIEMASEEENVLNTTSDLVVNNMSNEQAIIRLSISDEALNYTIPLSLIVPSEMEEIVFQEQLEQYLTDLKNRDLDQISIYPTDIEHDIKNVQTIKQESVGFASYLLFENQYFIRVMQEESAPISEAIAALKVDIPEMKATQTIPDHLSFSIREENDLLFVKLEESQLLMSDEITTTMIESILLTAKSYDFAAVKFENMPIDFIGNYNFEEPIEVPLGANPIYY